MAAVDTAKDFVEKCIADVYCEMRDRKCKGQDITKCREVLDKLTAFNRLEIWEDVSSGAVDLDDLYCTLPECLNR